MNNCSITKDITINSVLKEFKNVYIHDFMPFITKMLINM